jgi:uncharacterized Zn finger protein
VRQLAKPQSYDRGHSYYEKGAVRNVVHRSETLRADIEGSQYDPSQATIECDDARPPIRRCLPRNTRDHFHPDWYTF